MLRCFLLVFQKQEMRSWQLLAVLINLFFFSTTTATTTTTTTTTTKTKTSQTKLTSSDFNVPAKSTVIILIKNMYIQIIRYDNFILVLSF